MEDVADHRVIDQIHASIRHLESDPLSEETRQAIEPAMEHGLATTGGPELLLSWAHHTGMDAGRPWEAAIKQWKAWGAYRPPRRSGLPKGGISEVLRKTSAGRGTQPSAPPTAAELPTNDGSQWTFGRDTQISRVPIRLR